MSRSIHNDYTCGHTFDIRNIIVLEEMLLQNNSSNGDVPGDFSNYNDIASIAFYAVFMPGAFVGNVLCIVVVRHLVSHRSTCQSIPDKCVGMLATVDLLSVLFVHSVTLAALCLNRKSLPPIPCSYQVCVAPSYLLLDLQYFAYSYYHCYY